MAKTKNTKEYMVYILVDILYKFLKKTVTIPIFQVFTLMPNDWANFYRGFEVSSTPFASIHQYSDLFHSFKSLLHLQLSLQQLCQYFCGKDPLSLAALCYEYVLLYNTIGIPKVHQLFDIISENAIMLLHTFFENICYIKGICNKAS